MYPSKLVEHALHYAQSNVKSTHHLKSVLPSDLDSCSRLGGVVLVTASMESIFLSKLKAASACELQMFNFLLALQWSFIFVRSFQLR